MYLLNKKLIVLIALLVAVSSLPIRLRILVQLVRIVFGSLVVGLAVLVALTVISTLLLVLLLLVILLLTLKYVKYILLEVLQEGGVGVPIGILRVYLTFAIVVALATLLMYVRLGFAVLEQLGVLLHAGNGLVVTLLLGE